ALVPEDSAVRPTAADCGLPRNVFVTGPDERGPASGTAAAGAFALVSAGLVYGAVPARSRLEPTGVHWPGGTCLADAWNHGADCGYFVRARIQTPGAAFPGSCGKQSDGPRPGGASTDGGLARSGVTVATRARCLSLRLGHHAAQPSASGITGGVG